MKNPIFHPCLVIPTSKERELFIDEFKKSNLINSFLEELEKFDIFYQKITETIKQFETNSFKLNFHIELNGKIYVKFFFDSHLSRKNFHGEFNLTDFNILFYKHNDCFREIQYVKDLIKPLEQKVFYLHDYIISNSKNYYNSLVILKKFKPYDVIYQRELIKKFIKFPRNKLFDIAIKTYKEKKLFSLHSISFFQDQVSFTKVFWNDENKDYTDEQLKILIHHALKCNNLVPNLIHSHFSGIYDFNKPSFITPVNELFGHINCIKNIENF